jgi:signal transduction histidine kinase
MSQSGSPICSPISGYPGDLNQVWTNLITNAIPAMDEGCPKARKVLLTGQAGHEDTI